MHPGGESCLQTCLHKAFCLKPETQTQHLRGSGESMSDSWRIAGVNKPLLACSELSPTGVVFT